MKPRKRGTCPTCGKLCAIKKGIGPHAQGRGEVVDHKQGKIWCKGGKHEQQHDLEKQGKDG